MIAADLRESGIDVWDRQLLKSRPWPWLRDAILSLLDRPFTYVVIGERAVPQFTSRLQRQLNPIDVKGA